MTTTMAVSDVRSMATVHELGVEDVVAQVTKIQRVMEATMKAGDHYGVIPGTDKPTLLKPGAEKLCLTFRLDPQYEVTPTSDGAHLTVMSRCTLYHIPTGNRMGSGMGSCSTKESKYAYRKAARVCPVCGKDTIIRGKAEYGGGWLCFKKQGGCGAKYGDLDADITNQATGRVPNPDLPDQYNTVLKMANKRSLVAAVLNVTAASDIFTQDLEDYPLDTAKPVIIDVKPAPEPRPFDGAAETEPESGRRELPMPAQATAPLADWLLAFTKPASLKALQALWKGCTAPDLWETWSPDEQDQLTKAKDAAKQRLGDR
jgi:hypothetical protein